MKRRFVVKIAPVAVCLGLSLAVGVPHAVAAEATTGDSAVEVRGNNKDDKFQFYMASVGKTSGTGYRPKEDATSVYVRVDYSRGEPRIYVDGAKSSTGESYQDCSATAYRVANIGAAKQRRMRNYVNEWGYSHARITTWADRSTSEVEGYWSPDSNPDAGYPEMPSA